MFVTFAHDLSAYFCAILDVTVWVVRFTHSISLMQPIVLGTLFFISL